MQTASLQGDFQTALAVHEKLMPLEQALGLEPSPAGVKYAASLLGLCSDEVRLPILTAGPAMREAIREVLDSLGLK